MLNTDLKKYIKSIFDIKNENLIIGSFTELTNKKSIIADTYTIGNVAFTEKDVKINFFEEYCKTLVPSLADKLVNQNPDKTLQELRNIIMHHYEILDVFDNKKKLTRKELFLKKESEEAVEKYEKKLDNIKELFNTYKISQNKQTPIQKLIQETALNCERVSNKIPAGRLTMKDSENYILPYFNLNLDNIYDEIERLKPQDVSEYRYKYEYKKVEWSIPKKSNGIILQIDDTSIEKSDVIVTNNNNIDDSTIKEQFFNLDSLVVGYQYIVKKDIIRGDWYHNIVYNLNLKNKETINIRAKNELEELCINACKIPTSVIIGVNPAILIKGINKQKFVENKKVINKIFYELFSYFTTKKTENFKISESKEGLEYVKNDNIANVIGYEVIDVCQKKLFNSFHSIYQDLDREVNMNKLIENLFLQYVNNDLSKTFINYPFEHGILSEDADVINNFLYHAGNTFFNIKQRVNNKGFLERPLLLRLTLFGIICPILNAYYEKLFDIKYLASLELRHGSAQLNI